MVDQPSAIEESFGTSVKRSLKLTMPILLAQIVKEAVYVTGSVYMVKLNKAAVSAITIPMQVLLMKGLIGPLIVINILSGNAYGATQKASITNEEENQENRKIGVIYRQGQRVGLYSSILPLFISGAAGLTFYLGMSDETFKDAGSYLLWLCIGIPANYLLTATQQFMDATDSQDLTALFSVLTLPLNFIIGYGFMFGVWSFPKMGASGYALASSLQIWTNYLCLYACMRRMKRFSKFELFVSENEAGSSEVYIMLWKIGKSISVQISNELLSIALIPFLIKAFESSALPAHGAALPYLLSCVVPILAFQTAATALTAQCMGKESHGLVQRYQGILIAMGTIIPLTLLVLSLVVPKFLAKPFMDLDDPSNNHTFDLFKTGLPIFLIGLTAEPARFVTSGTLRGIKDVVAPAKLAIGGTWLVGCVLELLLPAAFNLGYKGIAIGRTTGLLIVSFMLLHRCYKKLNELGAADSEAPSIPSATSLASKEGGINDPHRPLLGGGNGQ
jgi:multidrug resistance protein, MATE family